LSVIFDEVTVKERLVVEGGNSGAVLSQFDGPVTFNKQIKFNDAVNAKNQLKVTNQQDSASTANGALVVSGGVGIAKNLNVGGTLNVTGATTLSSTLGVTGATTFDGNVTLGNATTDTVTFTARVNSNLLPSTTETYDLGSTTREWNNVYANTFVGALNGAVTGNADSATKLFTPRNFSITGDVDAPAVSFDGTGNVNLVTTLDNTGVSSATYGSATSVPQIAVDAKGRITSANNITIEIPVIGGSSNQVIYRNISNAITGSSNLTFDGTNLSVGGDITAFASDERLKENIQPLENALDKVLALNGFTYNFNETGQSLGFDGSIRYVGVSAQQVQAVLPEAVKPAPADSKYITVQYEKLVPLLIEAIKELKAEINELKGVK
jgi:cytoskeletal protein CcmA (bactofilin family)